MASIYTGMNEILDAINTIDHELKKHYYSISKEYGAKIAIKKLKDFFELNDNEVVVLSSMIVAYYILGEKPVSVAFLSDRFECTPLAILQFDAEIKHLEELCFITPDTCDIRDSNSAFYRIPDAVKMALINNDKALLKDRYREKDKTLLYPEDIKQKQLFYKKEAEESIARLYEYLEVESFRNIQTRLVEKGMSRGVCIMLYGSSGTGKTETVYQLAKATGRGLMHVDISSTVSQWKNGTANNLSQTFKKYAGLCEKAKQCGEPEPILLFNEADALFGKRLNPPSYGGEMEENHIQSVLLDLIERQQGILIVTTNMEGNFDEAYERRFLFKVKFEKPDQAIKTKIWKTKLSWLNAKNAAALASTYEFNGGEIDNIARKITMQEILTGKKSSFADINEACKEEKLHSKNEGNRIGF